MEDKPTVIGVGKVEFQHYNYTPESIHQFLKERKRSELQRIEQILRSFEIEESIIQAILSEIAS